MPSQPESPPDMSPAAPDPRELTLADFPVHRAVTTRWSDNDMYGHLNNAVYYELFDSAINGWQAESVAVDPLTDGTLGVVAESGCSFFAEVAFPTPLVVGLRVVRVGRSSVTYQLGLFVDPAHATPADPAVKALGHWVHVEIDAVTRRSTPLPDQLRALLETAVVPGGPDPS
jgi:acyl-CoA thioester hydrolase